MASAPSGFINLWKPPGITSQQAVARVKRVAGGLRVGHAGTLDPAAQGVLPLAVGSATRLLSYINLSPKTYRAEVLVGRLTDTGDGEGRTVATSSHTVPSLKNIASLGTWLEGTIWQIPPQVAALKIEGSRQYRSVRAGQVVWPSPRRVEILKIREISRQAEGWSFVADVGAGTYIRALVRDWGFLLGVAAHLANLSRIRVGGFKEQEALPLEQIERDQEWAHGLQDWRRHLAVPTIEIAPRLARLVVHGDRRALEEIPWPAPGIYALVQGPRLMGIVEGEPWRYHLVLGEENG